MNHGAHAVVVPRVIKTNGHFDGADPGYGPRVGIFQHEHIALFAFWQRPLPGLQGALNARRQRFFIGRKRGQPAPRLTGKLHEPGEIAALNGTDDHHDDTPDFTRSQASAKRSKPVLTSSSLTISAGAKRTTLAPAISTITPCFAASCEISFALPANSGASSQPINSPRPRISLNRPVLLLMAVRRSTNHW